MSTKDLIRRRETLPSLFNDFFRPWGTFFDTTGGSSIDTLNPVTIPAVNISENKERFEVSLAAPGMKKDNFNIDVEGNTLTISAETKEEKEDKGDWYTRREYSYSSFSRSFSLPEGVNKDKIDAIYAEGVLKLWLPKTDEAKKVASKHISVK